MKFSRKLLSWVLPCALLLAASATPACAALFTFEGLSTGRYSPPGDTVDGVRLSFFAGGFVEYRGSDFVTLSGNVLGESRQLSSNDRLILVFASQVVKDVSFNFATVAGPGILTAVYYIDPRTANGTYTFASTVPAGKVSGEGLATIAEPFSLLALTSPQGDFYIDNLNVTLDLVMVPGPEPSSSRTLLVGFGLVALFAIKFGKHARSKAA